MNETNSITEDKNDPPQSQSFYLPELDILRFFAFFAVLIHHCFSSDLTSYQGKLAPFANFIVGIVVSGGFGVDLFFALSSYLITELLIREEEKKGKINAPAFYMRRALRIFPLYYTFVLLSIFVFPYFFSKSAPLDLTYSIGFLFFVGNWVCSIYGFPKSFADPLWSVSIEEQFYITFPFLIMFLGVKRLKLLVVIFIVLAIISRIMLAVNGAGYVAVWCNSFARLDPIAGGILLALLLRSGHLKPIRNFFLRFLVGTFSVGLIIFSAMSFNFFGYQSIFSYSIVALGSTLLIWSVINPNKLKSKYYEPLIYLGRISYGLYVVHMLSLTLADYVIDYIGVSSSLWVIWRLLMSTIISIIIASISYSLIKKPFLKLKKRFTFVESRPL